MLAVILTAMLIAALNYNSNLGLAFAFLLASMALVTMHHCNRNLLELTVNATQEVNAFAGGEANFEFMLRNDSNIDRRDIEIRCMTSTAVRSVLAKSSEAVVLRIPMEQRGITHTPKFELRTRYPFGWFHAWTYVHASLTVYVAPSPRGTLTLPPASGAGSSARSEARGEEDFASLRTYEPGMPLKHMAWKVFAASDEAVVRTYSSLSAQPEWLEWSHFRDLDTEARLSQLCLWILEAEAAHRVFGLRIPGKEILPASGSAHKSSCLRALAVYGISDQP